jgi:ABC-2 type transport system permease protein
MKNIFDINKRKLRYGSYSIAVIIIFITAVIGLNLIVNAVPVSIDLTPNKEFSTGIQTKEVLAKLDKDIVIYALFDETEFKSGYVQLDKLIDDYTSNKHITLKFIDAYKNPGAAKQLDPDNFYKLQPTDLFFVCGDKKKAVTISDFTTKRTDSSTGETYDELAVEETLTGAIMYVTAKETPVIYFIQGHGEIELSQISYLNEYLSRNNFDIKTIETITADKIPDDADMLVFLSPMQDITSEERAKIQDFLNASDVKSKSLMVFSDYTEQGSNFTQINTLLEEYNLRINNDSIKENDPQYYLAGSQFYLLPTYTVGGYKVFTPNSRSVSILLNEKTYVAEEALLETSTKAESIDIATAKSTVGKTYIAARTEYTGGIFPTRVFVTGNTVFLSDTIISNYEDNMQFMLDQIKWTLTQSSDDIYIPGKDTVDLTITISQKQATGISLAFIIIIPLILFGAGTIIYVRRKNL